MILNSLNSNKVRKTSNVRTKKIRKIFAHCDFKCSNTTFFFKVIFNKRLLRHKDEQRFTNLLHAKDVSKM